LSFRSPFLFLRSWWWELLCFLTYFAFAASQLFMTPVTGLADNGDFPKVLGPADICDPNHWKDQFAYVYRRLEVAGECYSDSGLTSSEILFVLVIRQFADWEGHGTFKITGAGKIHLTVVLLALAILLWALHYEQSLFRFGVPPLILLIFGDVAYVSYLNSFYMDAGSMILLLLVVSIATAAILRPRFWMAIAFGLAGLFFVTSKAQHAPLAVPLAALSIWFATRSSRAKAVCWILSGVAALAGLVFMAVRTPQDYKAQALTNLIFFRFTPNAGGQATALAEFGLPSSYAAYIGTHSYSANSPVNDEEWRKQFMNRTSFGAIGIYYLNHPDITLDILGRGLAVDASSIRPDNLANFEREDGFPPQTHATRFSWWSNLRSRMVRAFPAHIVIFYAIMAGGAIACIIRTPLAARWPLYPLVLMLSSAGIIEFVLAVLGDCLETSRHLFLFQVITEILIVYGFAAILALLAPARRGIPANG
jgi:hypothetical protein